MYSRAYSDAELYVLTAGIDTSSFSLDFANGVYKNAAGYVRTNTVTNPLMTGGVAGVLGSGGSLPTSWSYSTTITGLTYTVSYGSVGGRPYIDFRASGTAGGSSYLNLNFETASPSASNGQTWTNAADIALQAGSLTNISQSVMQINENTSGGAYVSGGSTGNLALTSTPTRFWYTRTLSGGGTVGKALPIFTFNVAAAGAVDVTYRIFAPQLEQTAYPTSFLVGTTTTYTSTNPADVGNMTFTRASGGYAEDLNGNLVWFPSGVPRITNKGVLIEEGRTNVLLQSQALSTSPWVANGNVTLTANYALAPDGTMTATRALRSAAGGPNFLVRQYAPVTAQAYTMSVYIKSNTGQNQSGNLRYYDNVTSGALGITATPIWQRVVFPITSTASGSNFQFDIEFLSAGADVLVWGAQLEAGSFPTSYIPTTSASVTRAADVFYYSGLSLPSSVTFGVSAIYNAVATSNNQLALEYNDGNSNNRISLGLSTSAVGLATSVTGGTISTASTTETAIARTTTILAAKFTPTSVGVVINGGIIGTISPAAGPISPSVLNIGGTTWSSARFVNGYVQKATIYFYAASDNELTHRTRIIAAYNLLLESNSYLLQENNGLTKLEGYFA